MERFVGLIGIVVIFLIVFGMSNNRKAINYKTVVTGFILQILLAVFIFKVPIGEKIFLMIGMFIRRFWILLQKAVFSCLVRCWKMQN